MSASQTIELTFNLNHPPEKVWRALTTPDLLAQWLLPGANEPLIQATSFSLQAPSQPGWDGVIQCEVIESIPYLTLSYTWVAGDLDTVVSFHLTPTPAGTDLKIIQSGFKPDQKPAAGGARYGWEMMGERLVALLSDKHNRTEKRNHMTQTDPNVDDHLKTIKRWGPEITLLRKIVLDCGLEEAWKWKQPTYVYNKANVVILSNFKEYCALSFFKGSLLKDPHNLLVAPGENSQSSRLIKFTTPDEINDKEEILKAYLLEAIEVEKAGLKVEYKAKSEYPIPEELILKFEEDPTFKHAFDNLTPGRQKGYLLHFAGAKQSKSRSARIEKYMSRIFDGKGMQDCVCGLSKRYPRCDGSHKYADQPQS